VTEGGTDKNQPGQKPPRTIEIEFVQRTFVWEFCTRGGQRCVTYFRGSRDVWQSVTGGRGSKLAKNIVTDFMDGPLAKRLV